MSRIILTKHDDGSDHIVVGYDRAMATFYWQEFNREPDWDSLTEEEAEQWIEMAGYGGYEPGEIVTTRQLFDVASAPVKIALLEHAGDHAIDAPTVFEILNEHKTLEYPQSNVIVDLSQRSK